MCFMAKKLKNRGSTRHQNKKVAAHPKKHKNNLKPAKTHAKMKKVAVKKTVDKEDHVKKERVGRSKREAAANLYTKEEVMAAVAELSKNDAAVGYLKKNISKRALDVVNGLVTPKTDEELALELDMKINAVRRILNLMQGMGMTNYYVAKNVNGWLSFAWYINIGKLPLFYEYINSIENKKPMINNECNDYFICENCYGATKLIFTFDAAFEENFKCASCGKNLLMMDRGEATKLISASPQI